MPGAHKNDSGVWRHLQENVDPNMGITFLLFYYIMLFGIKNLMHT